MAAVIIIGIMILIIIISVVTDNKRQRKEDERKARLKRQKEEAARLSRLRREREEAEKQVKLKQQKEEAERQAKLKREQEEAEKIQRLQEELKYETVLVIFASIEEDGKPTAILKRNNNTYTFVERQSEKFVVGNLKLLRETTEKLTWVDENKYASRKLEQQRIRQLEIERKKDEEAKRLREIEERQQEELKKRREQEERERQAKAKLENLLVKKQNWREFQQVLQQNSVITLYHFTDRANIASIKKYGGLYSWDYCDENDIVIPYPGGGSLSRDLDRRYSLEDYVRVSFTRNHPMMFIAQNEGRIKNPVILTISLEVCYFQETRFANMNATRTGHKQGKNLEDLQSIHFNTVKQIKHFDLEEAEKPYFQAEVLVKTWIPIRYITNINDF